MKHIFSTIVLASLLVGTAQAQSRSIEDRVSELEAANSLNIFKFSGYLRNRYDHIAVDPQTGSSSTKDSVNVMRTKLALNVDAEVSKDVKFFSTLVTTKMWNSISSQNDTYNAVNVDTFASNEKYRDPLVYLEKAYMDWTITKGLIYTIGRLPTVYGTPYNYRDLRARMGTYPMLAHNTVADGMALTYKHALTENQDLAVRVIYTPFSQWNYASTASSPTMNNGTMVMESSQPAGVAMVEYNNRGTKAWDELTAVVHHGASQSFQPDLAAPALLSTLRMSTSLTTYHVDVSNVMQTGLNLSASFKQEKITNKGSENLGPLIGNVGFSGGPDSEVSGNRYLLAAMYRLPVAALKRPGIGFEYQKADKNTLAYDHGAEDLINFTVTRGRGWHAYYTQPLSDTLTLRLGHMQQNRDYDPFPLGAPRENKDKVANSYAHMLLTF